MSKKNSGKIFEENWKNSYQKLDVYFLRLNDAVKWGRGSSSSFVPKNPYDSLHYKIPFIWLLELKSTDGTSVSFNPNKPYEKPEDKKTEGMIKAHQVKGLMEAARYSGVIAGVVLNFREKKMKTIVHPDETYFIHINDLIEFATLTGKSGINRDDCKVIGIKIDSRLKKVNYTYDIEKFVNESPRVYLNKGYINKNDLIRARDRLNEIIGTTYAEMSNILYWQKCPLCSHVATPDCENNLCRECGNAKYQNHDEYV